MRRFDGRTVFVTGGAHGIGAATARRLGDEGATLVVADKDLQAADEIAAELGGGSCAAAATSPTVRPSTPPSPRRSTAAGRCTR